MKQGKPWITFVIVIMALALSIYFGVYVLRALQQPFTTTFAYTYTSYDSVQAQGVLVRAEQVLTGGGGIVDYTRGEGERVGAGQSVAAIYRDAQTQAQQADLDRLSTEIKLLDEVAGSGNSIGSAARLDDKILTAMVALRASNALGDYSRLETQVMSLKSCILKRGLTYGDQLTPEQISARLTALKSDYSALKQKTAQATTLICVQQSGIFSSLVDGYEQVFTPQSVFSLTPETITQHTPNPVSADAVGKLITDNRWYYAAAIPTPAAEQLRQGERAKVRFYGDFSQEVHMLVEQIGVSQGGYTAVVFSSSHYLEKTTLLREQSAELIFNSWTGLRVPKEALHMVKYESTDENTGAVNEQSAMGVYVLIAGKAEFKRVSIVTEGEDYYVLAPTNAASKAFRAGDEVIVRATGLHDGQLLEY